MRKEKDTTILVVQSLEEGLRLPEKGGKNVRTEESAPIT